MLYLIGLGLNSEKDISVEGLEIIKKCDTVYLEFYTSLLNASQKDLEEFYGKKIIVADRDLVEKKAEETILKDAKEKGTAFLVVGDVFGATTHTDLILRAKKEGIKTKIVHNASILTAVGATGLELYKFGKTTSMVYFDDNWKPATAYEVVSMNKKNKLHTLVLLDIKVAEPTKEDILSGNNKPQEPKFMTVNEGLQQFLEIEQEKGENIISEDTKVIGCARLGSETELIKYGTVKELIETDFGKPLHCIIIPGELHFVEEDFLNTF